MPTNKRRKRTRWVSSKEGRGSFEVRLDGDGDMAIVIRPDVGGPPPEELWLYLKTALGRTYSVLSEMEAAEVLERIRTNAADDEWSAVNRTVVAMQNAGVAPEKIMPMLLSSAIPYDQSVRRDVEEKLRHIARLLEGVAGQLAGLDAASDATFTFRWKEGSVVDGAVTTGSETVTFQDRGRN